ncbi:MAG: serine hydrolase [Candidatus Portnoybacteria bacterium]|jgi:D-alanyl-D-alanine carboxypeptidase (penicillin-binding protein 5/6)|nr:serine hydrolase [Candidatus Portnoybacteria bacterium]
MIKILTAILIALNPVVGLFSPTEKNPDASSKEAPLVSAAASPQLLPLSADIFLTSGKLPFFWPNRDFNVPEPEITAKTALVYDTYYQAFLFEKNGFSEPQPIASLTKLLTALVVMDNARLDQIFKVSRSAVNTYGEMGGLYVGESLTAKNLLAAMLIESSNDAAVALAENISPDFVGLMNEKTKQLGLKNSSFSDPSGLDPNNQASAQDLIKIMEAVLKHSPLQEIMQSAVWEFHSVDGKFYHRLTSTNKLLGQISEIAGGKTGYTEEAGNCMVLAVKSPGGKGFVISAVIAAKDRLAETKTLIEWTKQAFLW